MKELVISIFKKAKSNNKQLTLKQIIKKVNKKTSLGGSINSNGDNYDLVTKIINELIETKNIILHMNNDEKARYEIQDDEDIYDYKEGHNNESNEYDEVINKETLKTRHNFNNNYDDDVDDDIPLQNHYHNQKHHDADYDKAIPEPKRQRNISDNNNHNNKYNNSILRGDIGTSKNEECIISDSIKDTNLCAFTSTSAFQPGNN